MQVVYDKLAIDNWCSSHASSPDINTATVSTAINKDSLMRGTATHQWISRFWQLMLQKCF